MVGRVAEAPAGQEIGLLFEGSCGWDSQNLLRPLLWSSCAVSVKLLQATLLRRTPSDPPPAPRAVSALRNGLPVQALNHAKGKRGRDEPLRGTCATEDRTSARPSVWERSQSPWGGRRSQSACGCTKRGRRAKELSGVRRRAACKRHHVAVGIDRSRKRVRKPPEDHRREYLVERGRLVGPFRELLPHLPPICQREKVSETRVGLPSSGVRQATRRRGVRW